MDQPSKIELDRYLKIINKPKKSKFCEEISLNFEDEESEKLTSESTYNKSLII